MPKNVGLRDSKALCGNTGAPVNVNLILSFVFWKLVFRVQRDAKDSAYRKDFDCMRGFRKTTKVFFYRFFRMNERTKLFYDGCDFYDGYIYVYIYV